MGLLKLVVSVLRYDAFTGFVDTVDLFCNQDNKNILDFVSGKQNH